MPLIVNNETSQKAPNCVTDLINKDSSLKDRTVQFLETEKLAITSKGLLYVGQCELAVIRPDEENLQYLGTDDATTCHIIFMRHSGSGVSGVTHYDGSCLEESLSAMISKIRLLSGEAVHGRLEVHIIGGFLDPKNMSVKMTKEILDELRSRPEDLHLMTAAASEMNTIMKGTVPHPRVLGAVMDVRSGTVSLASFTDKGPDELHRHARLYCGQVEEIYNTETKELVIGPYDWNISTTYCERMLQKPDRELLEKCSTSPEQEPEGFVENSRRMFTFLMSHPFGRALFPNNRSYRYKKLPTGEWHRINP